MADDVEEHKELLNVSCTDQLGPDRSILTHVSFQILRKIRDDEMEHHGTALEHDAAKVRHTESDSEESLNFAFFRPRSTTHSSERFNSDVAEPFGSLNVSNHVYFVQ